MNFEKMQTRNKVIWQDGMFICPHHFQQQDFYYENMLNEYHLTQNAYGWGILDIDLDDNYLKMNKIALQGCSGIFPNGTSFNLSKRDYLPDIIDIPQNVENKIVYLGLPVQNIFNLDSESKKSHFRYTAFQQNCSDYCSTLEKDEIILVGKLNLSLITEEEEEDIKAKFILLPLFKIRNANTGIVLDKNYIPPCLLVKASNVLQDYINQILGFLKQYLDSKMSLVDAENNSKNQLQNLLILQTVSKYKYIFELLLQNSNLTPYDLLHNITSLTASISVFSSNYSLEKVKINYDHQNLYSSFNDLVNLLTCVFNELKEQTAIELKFKTEKQNIYSLDLSENSSIENSEIIIGITFTTPISDDQKTSLLRSIKIASILGIKQVMSLHVSGISITPITTLPYYISYNDKTLYFSINREGMLWEQIVKRKDIAMYINILMDRVSNVKLWYIPQTNK